MRGSLLVRPYEARWQGNWDECVRTARNGLFQFERDYMEYHSDRFPDRSMLVTDAREKVVAVLPLHEVEPGVVASHLGLTFGGLVVAGELGLPGVTEAFDALLTDLQGRGERTLVYKTVPHIYHRSPADDDRYCLFHCGARRTRVSVLQCIARQGERRVQTRRRRAAGKARKAGLSAGPSDDWEGVWNLLEARLAERHGARPVHTLREILYLRKLFPEQIVLWTTTGQAEGLVAAVVFFLAGRVARAQYIVSSEQGFGLGALDLLLETAVEELDRRYITLSLGSSNTVGDHGVSRGPVEQKEGFGARSVVAEEHEVDLVSWEPGTLAASVR